ncbi:DUF2805 domain-containing protein [Paucibacter sp. R3-3]|uniref:DUF2805 domain-containing protein n=1 Tax=Roseateles agri TaxID=3098619 RepID=A0ABU5DD14_9BURK|nr:DUF2805 domain-containing protein [Paucibacter sp. R3-3]MDY0743686.1 DUF2805 domain-containing protein [Paucibacter sp. R3-3]
MAKLPPRLSPEEKKRVIATAWTDLPPYLQIQNDHAISPAELNALMKRELTPSAYKEWAARGKNTKPATKSTWPHGR